MLGFLKKDMDFKLILMILALIIAFASFSSIYEHRLRSMSTEYENKSQELEKITARLISEEAKMQEISRLQEKAQEDKEAIEGGFNNFRDENEKLQKDLASIRIELENTKSELQDKTNKFNLLQMRFDQVEGSLVQANNDISKLSARVNELCEKLESAGGSDEDC